MNSGALVVAYHGCDVTTRDRLVRGDLACLQPSTNKYDWLGPGIYFFEQDEMRARKFAEAAANHPERFFTRRPIATPAVVGAVLCISHCLDMTTQAGVAAWKRGYEQLEISCINGDNPMPVNTAADESDETILLRQLDCAVFTTLHELMERDGAPPLQAVRGAFYQGTPLKNSSSEFRENSHIQLAVADPACVLGWFLPAGQQALNEGQFHDAELAHEQAQQRRRALKQRVVVDNRGQCRTRASSLTLTAPSAAPTPPTTRTPRPPPSSYSH